MPTLDRRLIAGLPPFRTLSAEELDAVLALARSMRHAKGAEIFSQDEEARSFYLLLSGHIRVVRTTPDGQQVIPRYINEGELFGIAMAMGRTTYPASAVAAIDCVVLSWPNSVWPQFQARFPSVASSTYETIGSRLQDTQARLEEISTHNVEQRVAAAILRLVRQSGRKTAQGVEIDFPVTRQDIAEMIGTTLFTVSRVLSAWESRALVHSSRQKIIVTNVDALAKLAEARAKD